jgi:plastocyanin
MKKTIAFTPKFLFRIYLVAMLAVILSACAKDNSTPANAVTITGMAFSPTTITVKVNTTVKWTNKDSVAHTVTSDTGLFDSGNLIPGAGFSHLFVAAGVYNYHCTYHSNMIASVIVQ